MAIYRSDNNKPQHRPEFIYIDERKERERREEVLSDKRSNYFTKLQEIDNIKYPFYMRIFTVIWSVLFALGAIAALVAFMGVFLCAALCLFRWQRCNSVLAKLSDNFYKLLVFSLGTFIGTVSPPFGFGIIVLYFMLRGEDVENSIFMRFLQSRK